MAKRIKLNQSTLNVVECNRSWNQCVQPIVFFFRFMGVNLETQSTVPERHVTWMTAVSLFWLIFHSVYWIEGIRILREDLLKLSDYYSNDGTSSQTFKWSVVIDHLNFFFGSFGSHLILLFVVKRRWLNLCKAFERPVSHLDTVALWKLRLLAFFSVILVITAVLSMAIPWAFWRTFETSFKIRLFSFLGGMFQIYPSLSVQLIAFISYTSSSLLQSTEYSLKSIKSLQPCEFDAIFLVWKQKYYLASHTVDSINECFGLSLLLLITNHFVAMITGAFYLFGQSNESTDAISVIGFLYCGVFLVNLFLICYVADEIRTKSDSALKELLRLRVKLSTVCCSRKVHDVVMETVLTCPQLNALGFFYIGRKLIPTLIGTTLTYYIILRQFYLAEN